MTATSTRTPPAVAAHSKPPPEPRTRGALSIQGDLMRLYIAGPMSGQPDYTLQDES